MDKTRNTLADLFHRPGFQSTLSLITVNFLCFTLAISEQWNIGTYIWINFFQLIVVLFFADLKMFISNRYHPGSPKSDTFVSITWGFVFMLTMVNLGFFKEIYPILMKNFNPSQYDSTEIFVPVLLLFIHHFFSFMVNFTGELKSGRFKRTMFMNCLLRPFGRWILLVFLVPWAPPFDKISPMAIILTSIILTTIFETLFHVVAHQLTGINPKEISAGKLNSG